MGSQSADILESLINIPETQPTHPELVLIGFAINTAHSPTERGEKQLSTGRGDRAQTDPSADEKRLLRGGFTEL